jgi:hypothetical protein
MAHRIVGDHKTDHCQRGLLVRAFGRLDSLLNRPFPHEVGNAWFMRHG